MGLGKTFPSLYSAGEIYITRDKAEDSGQWLQRFSIGIWMRILGILHLVKEIEGVSVPELTLMLDN
jgi:hypothetical protein